MKKFLAVSVAFMTMGAAASHGALALNWSYTGNLNGTPLGTFQAGWLVQLYQDVGGNTSMAGVTAFNPATGGLSGANTADDLLVNSATTTLLVNAKNGSMQWLRNGMAVPDQASSSVYTVIFNSAAVSTATQAVVVDSTRFSTAADGTQGYGLGTVANNWVGVVPEPGTMALLGIGAAVIGLRKRIRR